MKYKLSDLTVDGKGTYGIAASAVDYDSQKPTYLRITDINDDGTINFDGLKSVDDENSYKYILKENDIVFARTGASTGRSYFYQKEDGVFVYAGFLIKFSLDPKKVNPRYLKYYTHSKIYYDWVHSFDSGATRGNINAKTFGDMLLDLPERNVQDEIVSILKEIDDKIAVNRRICENLEAQAQALFKHWFIDFAPFKNGKFVESELGMIPEGWRVGTLGDIAEFKRGKTITKSETEDGSIPVVAGGLEPAYYHSQSNTSSRVITISGSGANAGFTRMYYQPVWASDCSFLDNSSTSLLHTAYCYLKTNKKKVDALQWGAAQPHVYAKDINKLPLVIAPFKILNQFELLITEMFDCIEVNDKENLRLSTLRDTLLPKLMSGQIKL